MELRYTRPVDLKPIGTKIPAELHLQVKVLAATQGKKIQDVVREALEEKVRRDSASTSENSNILPFRR